MENYYKKKISEGERDLADRNEELEAQHEELTAAVEALISKNEMLETAIEELNTRNKEIDQIVYRSSHDLKTPITALEGLITLMGVDPNSLEIYLAKSKTSLKEMQHTIKMLAKYSNNLVEELKYQEVDFGKAWAEVLDELEHNEGFSAVKFTFDNTCEKVISDVERIKLLLYNLVKNAIDFGSEKPRVDVSIQVKKECLKILVADNGIGMSNDIQSDVFNMFYRGDTKSSGSGLGLYLCKRTTEMLDGKIKLFSSLNVGTTVTIEIPIKKAEKS